MRLSAIQVEFENDDIGPGLMKPGKIAFDIGTPTMPLEEMKDDLIEAYGQAVVKLIKETRDGKR